MKSPVFLRIFNRVPVLNLFIAKCQESKYFPSIHVHFIGGITGLLWRSPKW